MVQLQQVLHVLSELPSAPFGVPQALNGITSAYMDSLGLLADVPDPVVLAATGESVSLRAAVEAWNTAGVAFVQGAAIGVIDPGIVNRALASKARWYTIPPGVMSTSALLLTPTLLYGSFVTHLLDRRVSFEYSPLSSLSALLCESSLVQGGILGLIRDLVCPAE